MPYLSFTNERVGLNRTVFAAGSLLRCLFRGRKAGKVTGFYFVNQRASNGSKQVMDLEPSSRVWGSMSDWPPWSTVTSHRDGFYSRRVVG